MSTIPHPDNYPQRNPDPEDLPSDTDGDPEDGLVDNDANYNEAGETDAVTMPPRRAPVDTRVSRTAPTETKAPPPQPREPLDGTTY
jgi:hypothetical protein